MLYCVKRNNPILKARYLAKTNDAGTLKLIVNLIILIKVVMLCTSMQYYGFRNPPCTIYYEYFTIVLFSVRPDHYDCFKIWIIGNSFGSLGKIDANLIILLFSGTVGSPKLRRWCGSYSSTRWPTAPCATRRTGTRRWPSSRTRCAIHSRRQRIL